MRQCERKMKSVPDQMIERNLMKKKNKCLKLNFFFLLRPQFSSISQQFNNGIINRFLIDYNHYLLDIGSIDLWILIHENRKKIELILGL